MKDDGKTKEELIAELLRLRRQNAELSREIVEFEESDVDYMLGARIGEILIEMGCLTFSQLHRALQRQKEEDILKHVHLGEIMIREGLITMEERDNALEKQQMRLRRRA